jgi:hypothetical protein
MLYEFVNARNSTVIITNINRRQSEHTPVRQGEKRHHRSHGSVQG